MALRIIVDTAGETRERDATQDKTLGHDPSNGSNHDPRNGSKDAAKVVVTCQGRVEVTPTPSESQLHSTLSAPSLQATEREFFIDSLLVRIHLIIERI